MIVHSLMWKSLEYTDLGGCTFFKSNLLQTKRGGELIEYEINIDSELSKYTLFLMYGENNWCKIGRYANFELASKAGNEHYQKLITGIDLLT